MAFGFMVTAMVLVLASAAYACTHFKGRMTVTVTGSTPVPGAGPSGGSSTVEGSGSGMTYCNGADPRGNASSVLTDRAHVDGVTVPPTNTINNPPDAPLVTFTVQVSPGQACPNQLDGVLYDITWNPSFAIDCMTNGGVGTQVGVLHVNNGSGTSLPYSVPAVGIGPEYPGQSSAWKYAGVCVTRVVPNVATAGSAFDGNRAPIRVY